MREERHEGSRWFRRGHPPDWLYVGSPRAGGEAVERFPRDLLFVRLMDMDNRKSAWEVRARVSTNALEFVSWESRSVHSDLMISFKLSFW